MSLLLAAWVDGCPQIGVGGCLCCFVAWGIIRISITSPPLLYHCHFRCFVLPWCGFFPLQSRVDSFHSAAKCRRSCFALEWIISAQVSFRSSVMVCRYKWSHSSATSAQALAPAVDGPRDGCCHLVLLHTSCRGFCPHCRWGPPYCYLNLRGRTGTAA